MKKYFLNTILPSQFQKYLFSTFIIQKFKNFNQNILNSMKKNDFIMKLDYILNLLSCTYVKNYLIFKHIFNLLIFFVYFTMLSPSSKSKQHLS
jgi:hypothetical protein